MSRTRYSKTLNRIDTRAISAIAKLLLHLPAVQLL